MLFGGSVGKGAPAAQVGAYLSLLVARVFKFSNQQRIILIITGISAGFSVAFGAPIATAFFALEALFAGKIMYRSLIPSIISAFVAFWCMKVVGVSYIYHPVNVGVVPNILELVNVLKTIIAGVVFGILAFIVIFFLNGLMIWQKKIFYILY